MLTDAKRVKQTDAAKIAYYLMAVDGDITKPEIRSFGKIANELGVSDKKDWEDAAKTVKSILDGTSDPDKIYSRIRNGVFNIIGSEDYYAGWSSINPYLFIWNLMTLSIADNDYSGNEEKLIKYVADKLGVDKSILLEMDNAIRALYSVSAEEKWLKECGRDESEISDLLSQLRERKKTIKNSVTLFFNDMED